MLKPKKQLSKARRKLLVLTVEECRDFFAKDAEDTAHYDELFGEHNIHRLYYEDLTERYTDTLNQAQAFLGLKPRLLVAETRKQNPEPLQELIENYAELYEAFKGTPEEALFKK